MTTPGDPGHVTGHNTLEDSIRAQADRFGVTVTLTGPYSVGAPNHIGVHNLERQAILDIAAVAGITVTVPDEAELGELGHTSDHDALTAAVAQLAAAPAWNTATGGVITDIPNYNGTGQTWRIHTFNSAGTFTVTQSARPFTYLVVAGGGAARQAGGWGGGRGGMVNGHNTDAGGAPIVKTLTPGAYPVVIGGGGQTEDSNGGTSSFDTMVCTGGNGASLGDGFPIPGTRSDITGTLTEYGCGGRNTGGGTIDNGGIPFGLGGGGNYFTNGDGWWGFGAPGTVIVAYQIA